MQLDSIFNIYLEDSSIHLVWETPYKKLRITIPSEGVPRYEKLWNINQKEYGSLVDLEISSIKDWILS